MLKQKDQPVSYVSLTGEMASLKNQIRRAFDSPLALDYMKVLEFNPAVRSFEEWPCAVKYIDDGDERTYTPDMLVHFHANYPEAPKTSWLVEIKSKADLKKNAGKYRRRFAAAKKEATTRGWKFVLLTEDEIRTTFLKNARFLLPFLRRQQMDPEYTLCFESIPLGQEITVAELVTKAELLMLADPCHRYLIKDDPQAGRARLQAMVWMLVARGVLTTDFHKERVTTNTKLWSSVGGRKQ